MKKTILLLTILALVACGRPGEKGAAGGRALIQNKGSDTLVNVAQAWAEQYKEIDADVAVAVTGGGSGTGISAMINGTVDIANASRKMKEKELEAARANGIEPLPNSISGILTGVILEVSRTAGETAPIMFTGAAFFLPFLPQSVYDQTMAMSLHLFVISTQVPGVPEELPYGVALVLIGMVLTMNAVSIGFRMVLRGRKKW